MPSKTAPTPCLAFCVYLSCLFICGEGKKGSEAAAGPRRINGPRKESENHKRFSGKIGESEGGLPAAINPTRLRRMGYDARALGTAAKTMRHKKG